MLSFHHSIQLACFEFFDFDDIQQGVLFEI